MEQPVSRSFARAYLPWIVAAGMLLLYFATLNTKVSLLSAATLGRVSGWQWQPIYIAPLTFLVTYPVRWLPSGSQLLAANVLGAVCAALALALLARCVAILPHDRTRAQRQQQTNRHAFLDLPLAWIPPLFAVLVCGLERTFWEHAVIGTGESLDLLIFAYVVRCLLEFRIEKQDSWLFRMALVYGIGIANNFAMIAFFPALLVALVWIKGLKTLAPDFVLKMFLLGLAGLSFYLVLPIVQSQSEVAQSSFWQALKNNFGYQKQSLLYTIQRWRAGWIALYALAPLLIAGVRWSEETGHSSAIGGIFNRVARFVLHIGLWAFCIYVAFDVERGGSPREIGSVFPFLPAYFLGALSIGYYTGYLLVVFNNGSERRRRRPSAVPPAVNHLVTAIVCAVALVVSVALAYINFPKVQAITSKSFSDFVDALAESVPQDKPVAVLSDDPFRLHALAAKLGAAALDKTILIDSAALASPDATTSVTYSRFLRKRYGDRIPKLDAANEDQGVTSAAVLGFLTELGRGRELIYLNPTFGYFLEVFYQEPRDLVFQLKPYPANNIEAPVPDAGIISRQTAYWKKQSPTLSALTPQVAKLPAGQRRYEHNVAFVGGYYSRSLNFWGVELQRAGKFDEAFGFFNEALALNPNNPSAFLNRDSNEHWRKERKRLPSFSDQAMEKLKPYAGDFQGVLAVNGPIDEPEFAAQMSAVFTQKGLYRQAAQLVLRALSYAPEEVSFQLALADIYVRSQQVDRALALVNAIRLKNATEPLNPALQLEIARIDAAAEYAKNNFAGAEKILQESLNGFPNLDASYSALAQLYVLHAQALLATNALLSAADPSAAATNTAAARILFTNAVKVLEKQLQGRSENPAAANFNHGNLSMYINDYDRAIASYTRALQLQPDSGAAVLNRAIANLQAKKLDAAERDYQDYLNRFSGTSYQVYYGLGEIAYQKKNWRTARHYYEQYLKNPPPVPAEVQDIRRRVAELKKK